jgi:hypothetical protein
MTRFRHALLRRPTRRTAALPFVVLAVLATFACSLDKLTNPEGATQNLTATVLGDTALNIGATTAMTISTSAGAIGSGVAVTWSSSAATVATVDEDGKVTGVSAGTATISAKLVAPEIGEVNATTRTIRVKYAGIKITAVDSLIAIGQVKVLAVRGLNNSGVLQSAIPFSSAMQVVSRDPTVFEVNGAGSLVAKANGTARLFVQYDNMKDSVTVKVRQVARSLTFPAAVNGEVAIRSLNTDRTLTVTPKDSLGGVIAGSTVAWQTANTGIVTIGATTGVARGISVGTARLRATVDGKIDSVLARVTQAPAKVTKVAGDDQTLTVGTAVTTLPVVAVLDSGDNKIAGATVTFAVASGGGSVTGESTTTGNNGEATVGGWTLGTTAGANTLTASSEGASATFKATGNPGPPVKLIFTTQPTNSASGGNLATFRVGVADANDNVVTSATTSITIAVATGSGTISGTTTVDAVNGVAVFSAVALSAVGNYTLTATGGSLTAATSNSFAVFGPPAKLGFITQPAGGTATIVMAPFKVAIQDASGNTVTNSTATVDVALSTGSFSSASTVSVAAVAGVATFSNVAIAAAGSYTINATSTGLTAAASNSLTIVTVGAATKLAFSVQPVNGTAGQALADIKVLIQDANGVTNTSQVNVVTLAIETNVGGASISSGTTQVAAVAGVATFSGIALNRSGTGYKLNATASGLTKAVSNTFNITAGAPFKLGFAAAIPHTVTGTTIAPPVQVQIQDANGNAVGAGVNPITVTATGGTGTLTGGTATPAVAGVATFSGLSLSAPGTYTLAATSTGLQTGTTASFSIVAATAAIKLAFITQPGNMVSGVAATPPVQVAVQDASGNPVSSTTTITLSIASGPSGATITGFSKAAVAGVATFDNLQLPLAGNGYSLTATATNLNPATSASFNVTAGSASKLQWSTQPQNATAGVPFSSDLQVQILDANNNVVTTATNTVALTYGQNGGGASITNLKGTLSVAAVNGVATFPGIRITKSGTPFTLVAQSSGFVPATSSTFDVSPAPASALNFRQQPAAVAAGAQLANAVTVAVADSLGNTVTGATNTITLGITSGPAGATVNGTVSQAAVSGVATFADIAFPKSGTYTISATSTDLATATSSSFAVSAGTAAKLGFSTQPTNTFVNAPMNPGATQVKVQVQDAQGNVVSSNATITIALGVNGAGATISGTLNGAASLGTYTVPTDVKINKAGSNFRLYATAPGLATDSSAAFNIAAFSTASQLAWTQQPTNALVGAIMSPSIKVAVQDQYGNTVTNFANTPILIGCTVTCSQGPNTATTAAGVATFPAYHVSSGGTFNLFATTQGLSTNLGAPTSSAFTISGNNGLVAWYRLEGVDGSDYSGNNNNGTIVGSPTATADHNGASGKALTLAAGQYIQVPNTLLKQLSSTMTVVMWIKHSGAATGGEMILSRRLTNSDIHFGLLLDPNKGPSMQCCSVGAGAATVYAPTSSNFASVNNNQWHQIAFTRTFGGSGSTLLYVDGVLVSGTYTSGSETASIFLIDADLFIGRQSATSTLDFIGSIDDVRIYNRILSQSEIQGLLAASGPVYPPGGK